MSFRARVRRAFSRAREQDPVTSQIQPSKSLRKQKKPKSEYPDNVYKPGEPMPKPKYGAPCSKAHQAKLSAFSFDDAWRRRASEHSQYSPRGSRLPSRVGSLRRKSVLPGLGLRSRRPSVVEDRLEETQLRDDDVGNVGLSKHPTRDENSQQPPRTADSSTTLNRPETQDSTASMYGRLADSEMGLPFTEAELALALTRTTIKS